MTTLYLDRRDLALKLEGKALAVYAGDTRQTTVPLHLLERVVMRSTVTLESGILARLAANGIGVLVFGGWNGTRVATVQGAAHNDAARRIGQYRHYGDAAWRRQWAQRLVLGKLQGQSRLIGRGLLQRPDLRRTLTETQDRLKAARARLRAEPQLSLETLRGIEGAAAVAYFGGLGALLPASLGFTGRNRRPPRDPVNAVLSLGYTMLHFEAVRACQVAGLDPLIGYYHDLVFGRESLACDLIEPLRPRLDAWAWEQFRTRALTDEHFSRENDACLLGKTGRQHFYRAYEPFVRPLRRLLRRFTGKLAMHLSTAGSAPERCAEECA
ncbi:CRISPR-associated endonuclease Cas1 [uncultured Thiodictyon sp.]|uniref:CRISPR-associated endonuclease Cas1 n=1 Tax=uncultured Thiodictyon sp. TaxID=1846217 RepID=UPI0025D7E6B5|nr:CRISPR-associated endonuclease Cas1 [uncultured Thiodictyon sp.]